MIVDALASGEPLAPDSAWERELASVLIDIARRPGRHACTQPSDTAVDSQEGPSSDSAPIQGKRKAPAPTGAREIHPDHHSRKDVT